METPNNRSFDGGNNNIENPDWGKSNMPLLRNTTVGYANGVDTPAERGSRNPNPRDISNIVCRQTDTKPNRNGLSDFIWAWGQFLDHEIDLTTEADPVERLTISIAEGDPALPRGGSIPFSRSIWDPETGSGSCNPRQQVNEISAYVDATNVYGNNPLRAAMLRLFDGTGRLKTTSSLKGDLLPYNIAGFRNVPDRDDGLFVAGDIRANEHAVLTSMHTLFVREHNRLCLEILAHQPELSGHDEEIYQQARKIVGGQMQAITYNEFLPALLGPYALKPYHGYHPDVNASIANVFSTAAYRLGHSMLSETIKLGPDGARSLRLRDAFFKPNLIKYNGIEPFLSGLTTQVMQEIDTQIIDDVRNFLFGPPNPATNRLLDLAALNIQRGRDHGLAGYNQARVDYGLGAVSGFSEISKDEALQVKLDMAYDSVNDIDPWVGGLAEDHVSGANVGEFFFAVLKDQFERLRDGDRFWYEHDEALSQQRKDEIKQTRLSDIILRNTDLFEIPENVFRAESCITLKKVG